MSIWNKKRNNEQIHNLAKCLNIAMNALYKIMDDQLKKENQDQSLISLVGKTIAEVEKYGQHNITNGDNNE